MSTSANGNRTIGLLHPGSMGAAIGAALRGRGHRVLWASEGRTPPTVRRAHAAALEDVLDLETLVARSEVILSVIPPAEALTVAASLPRFDGIYVEANAVSPETARAVAATVEAAGARCVDGSIIGQPPTQLGDSRLYLSGPEAETVLALFAGSVMEARLAGAEVGAASAVKVAYAGWTKGSMALLLALDQFSEQEGVRDLVMAEWLDSNPELEAKLAQALKARRDKGWRWAGEMREIATALDNAGLPGGFHKAAAEVYETERPTTA